jgi:type 1 fimbria pilin
MTRHARRNSPATPRYVRRALAAGALTVACLTATTGQAAAATTAKVKAGTLQIRGDAASDSLALTPVSATTLVVDVGEDGTTDFTFDRSTFTAISIAAGDGDGQTDTVTATGTARRDDVDVSRSGDQVVTTGLASRLTLSGSEGLNDTLRLNTLGGDDQVTIDPDAELLITPVIDLGADE